MCEYMNQLKCASLEELPIPPLMQAYKKIKLLDGVIPPYLGNDPAISHAYDSYIEAWWDAIELARELITEFNGVYEC